MEQVWRPMFESKVFWKQMYCIEERTCDIVETFRRPHSDSAPKNVASFCGLLAPLLRPWIVQYINCSSFYMSSGWMKQNFTELSPFFSKHLLFTPVFNSDLLPQHMVNRNRSKRLNRLNSSLL